MNRRAFLAAAVLLGALGSTHAQQIDRLNLRLAPAALGATLSLQQNLRVEREGRLDFLDVALEIDPERIALVGLALGMRVLSLEYDGEKIRTWRHFLLPAEVRAEDILEDIQLTYWPAEAVRAALPEDWRIEDQDRRRTLWRRDEKVMEISYSADPRWDGEVVLSNLRYQYRITIRSVSSDS